MDIIKNKSEYKNNIFIFDRGYMSKELFKKLHERDMFYICRLRENSTMISETDNDHVVKLDNNTSTRIITYTINKQNYYIATNLFNKQTHSINTIKQLYHDRWSIEEYFKYIKSSTNLKKMNEKREISIKKSMYAQLIVSQIASIFNNLNKPLENNTKIKKVNRTHLTKGQNL